MEKKLREQARQFRNIKEFKEAILIYDSLWTKDNKDKWLGWEYAYCLKYDGDISKAIYICKNTFRIDKNFAPNNNLMSWCVYEKYFMKKDKIERNRINEFIKMAEVITSIIDNNENSPYKKIIFRMIEILRIENDDKSNQSILYWINKLDEKKLSNIPYSFDDERGKKIEIQSELEEFYSIKSRTLLHLKKYEECIKCCDKSFERVNKFHYDNDIWIEVRRLESIGMLDEPKNIIVELEKLTYKKPHFSLFYKISQLHWEYEDKESAFLYAYKALMTHDDDKMKVKVIYELGKMLETTGKLEEAAIHYAYYKKIKLDNAWNIPSTIDFDISRCTIGKIDIVNLEARQMKKLWTAQIKKRMQVYQGVIVKVLPNNKSGFIMYNNKTIFFKTNQVIDKKRVREKDKVNFCITTSYNKTKAEEALEAIYLEVVR